MTVPIGLYTAAHGWSSGIHFNQLHKGCNQRIRQAKVIFKDVTDALLDSRQPFEQLRPSAAPAAFAYALMIAQDWATKASDMGNDPR